jgi:NAD dependent epimerase/dehydratase family enzyme
MVITGATGFVGRQVARQAAAGGHTVVGVTRDVQAARRAACASVSRWVSLGSTEMARAIDESGCVVNLAGAHPFGGRWTGAIGATNRSTTTRLPPPTAFCRA